MLYITPTGGATALTRVLWAGLALAAAPAVAQDEPLDLGTIVLTANNREQAITDVQASVEVITREEIARTPGRTAIDALRNAAGVDARSSGANSSVTIRGQIPNAGSSVLILVDGLPRTGKYGLDNLNLVAVENIERIEVIRGPMSALYGADASAGVINIITTKPDGGTSTTLTTTLGASASNHGDGRESFNLGFSHSFTTGDVSHRISAGARLAEPFRFNREVVDDLSGIRHYNLEYAGHWQIDDSHELSFQFSAIRQDDRADGQSTFPVVQRFRRIEEETQYFGALRYAGEVGPGRLMLDVSHGFTDGSANRSMTVEETEFHESLVQARYQFDTITSGVGTHDVQIGAGYQYSEIDVNIYNRTGERGNLFGYVQNEWKPTDRVAVVAGLRIDDYDDFGTEVTPRLTIGSVGDGLTWRLGYGEAYRAPSLIEQYSSFTRGRFLIVGDPDIGPETTEAYEAAIGWRADRGGIEAIYHHADIDGLIEAQSTGRIIGGLSEIRYQNVERARIRGVEVVGDWQISDALSLSGSYAYLDAENASNGDRLEDRPQHEVKLAATWENGPFSASLAARGSFDYFATDSNAPRGTPPSSSDYVTVDTTFSYAVNDRTTLTLGIENIADKRAPLNYNPNQSTSDPAGRFVYFTAEARF